MVDALITGASGFIGPHLANHLALRGREVCCLVRESSDVSRLQGYKLAIGDIRDEDSVRRVVRTVRPRRIFHLAGLTKSVRPADMQLVNEMGTNNLLRAVGGLDTPAVVVMVSTLAAAGPSRDGTPKSEGDDSLPVSDYGRSKLATEAVARAYSRSIPISIVRPPIVLGPYDRDGLEIFKAIAQFGVHAVPTWRGLAVSWIHAADLACALERVSEGAERLGEERPGQGIYYATSPEHVDYATMGRTIGAALGRAKTLVVRTPSAAVWGIAGWNEIVARVTRRPRIMSLDKAREATAGAWLCSGEKLAADTGFQCQWTFADAICECVQWYRDEGWIS